MPAKLSKFKVTIVTKFVRYYIVRSRNAKDAVQPLEDIVRDGKPFCFPSADTYIANIQKLRRKY